MNGLICFKEVSFPNQEVTGQIGNERGIVRDYHGSAFVKKIAMKSPGRLCVEEPGKTSIF